MDEGLYNDFKQQYSKQQQGRQQPAERDNAGMGAMKQDLGALTNEMYYRRWNSGKLKLPQLGSGVSDNSTPRPSGRPPTATGFPRSAGVSRCSMENRTRLPSPG